MKTVFTNGCFDIIHVGHVKFLNYCKGLGDILVVGLNSDESVRRLKGEFRPINGQYERKEMLLSLGVDDVRVFDEDTPENIIKSIRPDILVKGSEWRGKIVGQEFVESYGGKVIIFERNEQHSTSKIIEKVRKIYEVSKATL